MLDIVKELVEAMSNIELIKLYNGDIIIGEIPSDDNASNAKLCIDNPRLVMMVPSMNGSMGIALKSVCFPFACNRLKEKICIEKSQVMFTLNDNDGEIDKELVNGYKSEVSGIQIASAAEAASIAAASKTSSKEFII